MSATDPVDIPDHPRWPLTSGDDLYRKVFAAVYDRAIITRGLLLVRAIEEWR